MNSRKKIILLIVLILGIAGVFWFFNTEKKKTLGSAVLSWNANSETDLAGYKIYYGKKPRTDDCPKGGYEKVVDVGKKVNYTVNNLELGQTYYFSVTSYNSAKKESCFSGETKKEIKLSIMDKLKNFLK
ncbi:MAG: hypothetical protein A2271_02845 [Candidatus Moranbacteria bacterium RIFOXYA12_FULL_35_19]|nr:MAG: hypothetical protein UR78_C0002G0007 [Candidatus Moranbacteria bacterium GW2011_GWF2_35_39]OGI30812.1 MAG: hypothetical protein A2343_01215 [Candidatus Moranbacteria bacterium RIFOXYB12_FULL_35_8]OGI33219.1 MAG: hypothetical protein A2489_04300 [Candidatus Moranbacteria bacterium RIFOXYC12_FULL_36_13]OGI36619.1 MAG: hypothetical protein A2271_02845 [Candidatus Moranbacteria bacterium RIFOXYA12_FULL_35_19]